MPNKVRVTRRKFVATGAALAAGSVFAPGVQAAPAGVTFQAIDGETISNPLDPTTMTHSYYARRGLTFATDKSFNGTSWDDPSFFPIVTFYSDTATPSITKMKDLGYNTAVAVNAQPANFANFASNGIWYFDVGASYGNFGWTISATDKFCMGCYIDEPPGGGYPITTFQTAPIALTAHRIFYINFTYYELWARVTTDGSYPMSAITQPNYLTMSDGSHRAMVDLTGFDYYWFADSVAGGNSRGLIAQRLAGMDGGPYIPDAEDSATVDKRARGSNYGNMIDAMRLHWSPSGAYNKASTVPLILALENGAANDAASGSRRITPSEMWWGAWSQIIHGARGILWFYWLDIKGLRAGDRYYDTTKLIDKFVLYLAPMIHSPFAVDYVTVSPNGYVFPYYVPANFFNSGIECCAHYYAGPTVGSLISNRFYIIAGTRGSGMQTNINATFTIKNSGATKATELVPSIVNGNFAVSESRSVPITSGTAFSDTFATAYTTHVYRIDP